MDTLQEYEVSRHHLRITCGDLIRPPTLYTLFLANHIPEMSGQTVVDVGTGHGMLAIVAILQGAGHVYLLDSNPDAISSALKNAELNGVGDRVAHLPIGKTMIPLPPGELVDMVLSNPAQLPLPESGKDRTHFYVGGDGR